MENPQFLSESLKTFSTDDLLDELAARCSPMIFIGTKYEGIKGGGYMNFYRWNGHPPTCYGMCHEMAVCLNAEINRRKLDERADGEEDTA